MAKRPDLTSAFSLLSFTPASRPIVSSSAPKSAERYFFGSGCSDAAPMCICTVSRAAGHWARKDPRQHEDRTRRDRSASTIQEILTAPVVTPASVEPDPIAVASGHEAVAIVLDFVDPCRPFWDGLGRQVKPTL